MISFPIYLDNHSTTRVDPLVLEAMLPYFTEIYGNAASKSHEFGWKAEAAVEFARKKIAALINAEPGEIIFTSGATESINLAIKGIAEMHRAKGNKIITTKTEHKAVLDTCKSLQKKGYEVVFLDVDNYGLVSSEKLKAEIDSNTILVSVIYANNEIGSINDICGLADICQAKEVLFHTDATQAAGTIPINVMETRADLMSFSGHKLHGPKGIGVLYLRNKLPKIKLAQQIEGGGHERGLRSGTLNVPAIVGFGKASEICSRDMTSDAKRIRSLRDMLESGLVSMIEGTHLNGHPENRLYNNLNLSFEGIEADTLMMSMKEIAVSSGSACSSASIQPSHVLKAIGLSSNLVKASIRFGLGRFNTEEEVEYVISKVVEKVKYLRQNSTAYKLKKGVNA